MLKFLVGLVAVPGVSLALATATAAQTFPANLPIAITCYAPHDQSWYVGYLSKAQVNGDALYMGADGKRGTTVNAKGIVVRPANRQAILDCYDKTLDELRANGRVLDLPRPR